MEFLDRLLAQVNTLKELWPSFLVVCVIAGFGIWKLMGWRYQAIIDGLNHRISLRDDTISHLQRNAPEVHTAPAVSLAPEIHHSVSDNRPVDPRTVQEAPEYRVFVTNKSASDLMKMLDNMTQLKAEALARPYVGKWIEITLPVQNVIQRENETLVMFIRPESFAYQIWLHFSKDRDRLEILEIGDTLTAIGKITELSAVNMRLYGCEMVKAE